MKCHKIRYHHIKGGAYRGRRGADLGMTKFMSAGRVSYEVYHEMNIIMGNIIENIIGKCSTKSRVPRG